MKKKILFIPLALFLLLAALLFWQLLRDAQGDDPMRLESALIGKPLPQFTLTSLFAADKNYDRQQVVNGQPFLLNVWATWCPTCRAEHHYLNDLAKQGVRIIGLDYKDDRNKAVDWLNSLGNPYALSVYDAKGMLGLDLGVYGAPETFLVDGQGVIRYRHAGDINAQVWQDELQPLWQTYSQQAGSQ